MYQLTFMTGPRKGRRVAVAGGALVMGRHPDSQLVFSDDESVAERQAIIEPRSEGCMLTDLGGRTPTLVNGTAVRGSIPLRHRDQIEIGRTLLLFSAPEGTPSTRQRRRISLLQSVVIAATIVFIGAQFVFLAGLETLMEAPLPHRPAHRKKPAPSPIPITTTNEPVAPSAAGKSDGGTGITHGVVAPTRAPAGVEEKPVATAPVSSPVVEQPVTNSQAPASEMLRMATLLAERGQWEAADQQLARIEDLAPSFLPVYVERANLYEQQGRLLDASRELSRALPYAADPGLYDGLTQRIRELQAKIRGGATPPAQGRLR